MVDTYTFNGMSRDESAQWLKAMRGNIELPRTKSYRWQQTNKGATLRAKEDRQKRFREDREKELQEKLKQHQKYRTLGEVTFTKGEPLALDCMKNDDGRYVTLSVKEVEKLESLCKNGVFKQGETKATERKAVKPGTVPTMKECLEKGYDEEEAEMVIAEAAAELEEYEAANKKK